MIFTELNDHWPAIISVPHGNRLLIYVPGTGYKFPSNIVEWLDANTPDYRFRNSMNHSSYYISVMFRSKNHAMLFKLTWCGTV